MNKDNIEIAETIHLLENGPYRDKKEYLKKMLHSPSRSVSIGNFEYSQDVWCWIIWKKTDIGTNPEYKGESLCKVVPRGIVKNKIGTILNALAWVYI